MPPPPLSSPSSPAPQADLALQKENSEARAAGRDITYIYRHLYLPQKGMFCGLEEDLKLGQFKDVSHALFCLQVAGRGQPSRGGSQPAGPSPLAGAECVRSALCQRMLGGPAKSSPLQAQQPPRLPGPALLLGHS